MRAIIGAAALLLQGLIAHAHAQAPTPSIEKFASEDGALIEAHIFTPSPGPGQWPRPAIVLVHGGGWTDGAANWVYPRAARFAQAGMVAVAIEYRLSDAKGETTPAHALADVRAGFRWLRANAARLDIDPERVAAYGVSAGGQLAVMAAASEDVAARPDLLVLVSPALDLERDEWFVRVAGRDQASALAPLRHVRAGMAPALVLQGDVDTLTPLAGAVRFCALMRAAGNTCDIEVSTGFGHLFTPAGVNDRGQPQPDPAAAAVAAARAEAFLRGRGYIR